MCYTPLRGRKKNIYAFENTCNHGDIKRWLLKKCLFDTFVTHWCFFMGWKYGMVASLNLLGKSLKMSKKYCESFNKLRNNNIYPPPWDRITSHRDHSHGKCCWIHTQGSKKSYINFRELHGNQAKRSKRRIKAKFCVPIGYNIWKNGLVDGMQHTCFMIHH